MKIKPKKKRLTVSKMKGKVWDLFSQYIRLRDCLRTTGSLEYGECFTCAETLPFKELQAGHYIAGRHNANLFSERGTQAQCKRCNCIQHGRPLEYRRQLIKLYGEGVDDELEEEARQTKRFTISELELLAEQLKQKIKEVENDRES